MKSAVKREDVAHIEKRLNEARLLLKQDKLHSCLVKFKESLENLLTKKMLPADNKNLNEKINEFQSLLAGKKTFIETYGPVTFRDNDARTTLEFVRQLLLLKDQEMKQSAEEIDLNLNDKPVMEIEKRVEKAKSFMDNHDYEAAKAVIEKDADVLWWLLQAYNTAGIEFRRTGCFHEALVEFNKALVLEPDDEGLYYNLARVHIELNEWQEALNAIQEALKISPDFIEGKALEGFIQKRMIKS